MAEPKYTGAYLAIRNAWKPVVDRGEAQCHEPICLEELDGRGRGIRPGSHWHLSHDTTGTVILGPSHRRCNVTEAAVRGNQQRASRFLKL